ncbi:hypothetical protein LJR231_001538 [Phyllobacterium sp. LjRoot231]|uniref:hypothetical protein n=1 Tax=Phyllobacterium sp. LjRoot231 TaxID=3342289 RepID=UPI003ECDA024
MVDAILSAGQFVHADRQEIIDALDKLFDPVFRKANPAATWDREVAVPDSLYKVHLAGYLKFYQPWDTVRHVGEELGLVCCLCGDIARCNHGYSHKLRGFERFICPDFLSVTTCADEEDDQVFELFEYSPACAECLKSIGNRRTKMWRRPPDYDTWAEGIANLLVNNSEFEKRVLANAGRWERLRFDPRKPAPSAQPAHRTSVHELLDAITHTQFPKVSQ